MDANGREWILKDAVYAIAGAAMQENNEWGAGFLEAAHQETLKIQLELQKIPIAAQPSD